MLMGTPNGTAWLMVFTQPRRGRNSERLKSRKRQGTPAPCTVEEARRNAGQLPFRTDLNGTGDLVSSEEKCPAVSEHRKTRQRLGVRQPPGAFRERGTIGNDYRRAAAQKAQGTAALQDSGRAVRD